MPSTTENRKRRASPEPSPEPLSASTSTSNYGEDAPRLSSQQSKKLKLQTTYASASPFPQLMHPTEAEARDICRILHQHHTIPPGFSPTTQRPNSSSNAAKTCGSVPNVLESLIGTILSQNTSGRNCARAKAGLDEAFGRNNFSAIVDAPLSRMVEAIRTGGLANKKARTIRKVLVEVRAKHGEYSLQHLASEDPQTRMSDAEIMQELLSYDGVGPKTASCVLLFCLGRHSFAVDTHIFRISKMLGWVPPHADRILAQAHLNIRIPDDIKYELHVLMIQHGRSCRGCKTPRAKASCPLVSTHMSNKRGQIFRIDAFRLGSEVDD